MTIAALRQLLDEIDTQGGPDAARHNRLNLPDEGTEAVNTTVHAAQAANSDQLPVGKLLAWGDAHLDPEIQDQAARARIFARTRLRRSTSRTAPHWARTDHHRYEEAA